MLGLLGFLEGPRAVIEGLSGPVPFFAAYRAVPGGSRVLASAV